MNPVHWCSIHGSALCELAAISKSAWQDWAKRTSMSKELRAMVSVDKLEPTHVAAYSENDTLKELQADVRRQAGVEKARTTRKRRKASSS